MHPSDSSPHLAHELSHFVSIQHLEENKKNYAELAEALSTSQEEKIRKIQEVLLHVPLFYTAGPGNQLETDLLPFRQIKHEIKPIHGLQQSLGLDQYVFLHWGIPERSFYGNTFIIVSSQILLKPETVVTPGDFSQVAPLKSLSYHDLTPQEKELIDAEYFSLMVTGKTWLDIIARRVLSSYEDGSDFFILHTPITLGEIKHFGSITADMILEKINDGMLEKHYKLLYDNGVAYSNMEQVRSVFYKTGHYLGVDPLPEDCGVDYKEARLFWTRLLDPQNIEKKQAQIYTEEELTFVR